MKRQTVISKSAAQTKRLAAKVVQSGVRVIALTGDLGSGKTTFVQGIARALGIRRRITSPTFIVFKKHRIPKRISQFPNFPFANFYHVDLYRVHQSRDLHILGFKKLLRNPENFVAIEWAELAKRFIPRSALWIRFKHGEHPHKRIIVLK